MNSIVQDVALAARTSLHGRCSGATVLTQQEFHLSSSEKTCPSCRQKTTGARHYPEVLAIACIAQSTQPGRMLVKNFNQAERCALKHERPPK
ncbi:MAG: hypothetical protein M0Q93_00835 [Terrimicrobiaceae bacterium]|jgi:hypothetical protein|nr:hypothetical protein [Terrimicrobiaceae bacterium]